MVRLCSGLSRPITQTSRCGPTRREAGAVGRTQWLQLRWGALPIASASIAAKEFFPIVVAAACWGRFWHGATVCFHCDNAAVVEVLNRQSAKDQLLGHHLRSLFFIGARCDFDVVARHTPGAANTAADALSRNNVPLFRQQVQGSSLLPTPIPPELAWGLSTSSPQWRSRDWSTWLNRSLPTR